MEITFLGIPVVVYQCINTSIHITVVTSENMTIPTLHELGIESTLITNHQRISCVEELRNQWATMPIFSACKDPSDADRLIKISLGHTYLFGRITMPSYIGHLCFALRSIPPVKANLAQVVNSNIAMFTGEVCSNNIFGGVAHAHYHDMLQAYTRATLEVEKVQCLDTPTFKSAKQALEDTGVWTDAMLEYADHLETSTLDPLSTFLIAVISEETISESYKTILKNLNDNSKYDHFRTFMQRHIELDTAEHGPAAVRWLNTYLQRASSEEVNVAMSNTELFIQKRIDTYRI
jgi:hypothetical protein